MHLSEAVQCVLRDYPRLFFACHRRHVHDPHARRTLSSHQASILDHLDDVDAISLNALAEHMGVTASTMSLNVERLVQQGYVLRQRDAVDARRVRLRLSAAGLRIKSAQSVLDPQRLRLVLEQLSTDDRAAALRGLALLAQAALSVPPVQRAFPAVDDTPSVGRPRKARRLSSKSE